MPESESMWVRTMSFRDLRENISATRSLLSDAVRHLDAATPPNETVTPSRSVLSGTPAAAQRQQGPSRMPAGGQRQQRSTSITYPYRPFTSGSLKRSKLMQGNIGRSKKKKVAMWEKEFICLAYVDQKRAPSSLHKSELIRAGLGVAKV